MSLYATPPGANLTEEERRIRHAQLMYLMGIGDGGLPSGPTIDPRLSFWAPLTNSLIPTKAGNPVFSFQRPTSTAYVADHQGILRLAQFNEARFQGARRVRNWVTGNSQDCTNGAWTKAGTTPSYGATGPTGLPDATTLTATSGNGSAYQLPTGAVGITAVTSYWIRRRTGTGAIKLIDANSTQVDLTAQIDGTWRRLSLPPVVVSGTAAIGVVLIITGDAVDITYMQFEQVNGQSNQAPGEYVSVGVLAAPYHGNAIDGVKYFPTTNGNSVAGNIVTEAQGTLIPTATMLGYVAENAAMNICLQSQTFDVSPWTQDGCAVTANDGAVPAPDGTITADRFTDTVANAAHRMVQSNITATAQAYTYSVYLKAGTLTWAQVYFYDGTTTHWANFNIATGVVGNKGAGATSTITALPNGWYRCTMTGTMAALSTCQALIYSLNADTASPGPSYVGTGQTMYLWGAQVETGADPSSYVPTTTVAVVRATDALSYPVASNIDSNLGTSYAEVYPPVARAGSIQSILYRSTVTWYVQYFVAATKALGVFQASTPSTANVRVLGTVNKGASAWGGVTNSVCLNGGAVASGAFNPSLTTGALMVGNNEFSNEALQGCVRNVKIYATKLTDVEIQALTA